MNRKAIRAILFTLAAAVWGAVMVKAFVRRPTTDRPGPVPVSSEQALELRPDAPALDLAWARDPFLDHHASGRRPPQAPSVGASTATLRPRPLANVATPARVDWPAMEYVGRIGGGGGQSKPVALFQVNGRDIAIRTGDHWRGIQVVTVEADSVVLQQGSHTRSLRRGSSRSERDAENADGTSGKR